MVFPSTPEWFPGSQANRELDVLLMDLKNDVGENMDRVMTTAMRLELRSLDTSTFSPGSFVPSVAMDLKHFDLDESSGNKNDGDNDRDVKGGNCGIIMPLQLDKNMGETGQREVEQEEIVESEEIDESSENNKSSNKSSNESNNDDAEKIGKALSPDAPIFVPYSTLEEKVEAAFARHYAKRSFMDQVPRLTTFYGFYEKTILIKDIPWNAPRKSWNGQCLLFAPECAMTFLLQLQTAFNEGRQRFRNTCDWALLMKTSDGNGPSCDLKLFFNERFVGYWRASTLRTYPFDASKLDDWGTPEAKIVVRLEVES
jgi:hypothetical protein